jgi:glycosyltransferase involved in cell wall biosynthesis
MLGRTRFEKVDDGLWIAPLSGIAAALPMSHPEPWRRHLVRRLRNWLAEEAMKLEMERPVYWFYWWFLPELAESAPGPTVYDVIDEHTGYAANAALGRANERAAELERRLLLTVDHSFAVSSSLVERKGGFGTGIELLPNGIDPDRAKVSLAVDDRPSDMTEIEGPVIGYAGDVGARLDWELVGQIARRRPQWSIVLIGGEAPNGVPDFDNLHVLPGRPYGEILRCIREFDVAMLPLRENEFNRSVSSLKLLDYLAVGKPVVAPDLPFVHDISDRWPGPVSVAAAGADGWEQAIAKHLGRLDSATTRIERKAILMARTTDARVGRVLTTLGGQGSADSAATADP